MAVNFGLNQTNVTASKDKLIEQLRLAEQSGFGYFWMADSQIMIPDLVPYLTLCALNSEQIKLGTCVTPLTTRHPTVVASQMAALQGLSGGRMILGLGKGDSAIRLMGERPPSFKEFKERVMMIIRLANGEELEYRPEVPAGESWYAQGEAETLKVKLTWLTSPQQRLPLYLASYGPKTLEWCGQVADGVFLQMGEPGAIKWAVDFIRRGAEKAGRNYKDIDVVACTATLVSDDLAKARDFVRWFPAAVSNHIQDVVVKGYPQSELPESLRKLVELRVSYDYREHARRGAQHAGWVTDELAEGHTIIGSVAQCKEKIRQLQEAGVTQICLYLVDTSFSHGEILSTIKLYGEKIIPAFRP